MIKISEIKMKIKIKTMGTHTLAQWTIFCIYLCTFMAITSSFDMTILHTNDVHARVEQFNKYGSDCDADDAQDGKCYGGIARRVTKVNEIRNSQDNVILLDAGDQFSGTIWFSFYKGNITSFFMKRTGYDVMCLGNHEFDLGVEGLVTFLDNVTFSVVSANTNVQAEPRLQEKFSNSTVMTVGGQQIGIIGYLTQDTAFISIGGPTVTFDDVITSVTDEVAVLTGQGINKIIALGHAGYRMDQEVAKIEGVDVVVGGHSNTFLYTGEQPSSEAIQGPYPTVVTQASGKTALVVQEYTWGKYLGYLNVTFNDNGDVTQYNGNPILLDSSIAEENETAELVNRFAEQFDEFRREVIGSTNVYMNRASCSIEECTIGNIITDAIVDYHVRFQHPNNTWAPAAIAVQNSGGIRANFEKGPINIGNVISVLPFGNEIDLLTVKGSNLREQLELSVRDYAQNSRFLQFSGLKVVYNITRAPGNRVLSVDVRCLECDYPSYYPLKDDQEYNILMISFLSGGGEGYNWEPIKRESFNSLETTVFNDYIKRHSPVYPGIEGRITFKNSDEGPPGQDLCPSYLTARIHCYFHKFCIVLCTQKC